MRAIDLTCIGSICGERWADLSYAHLVQADLRYAYLKQTTIRDAHLEGAHLDGAHLEGATLTGAYLEGAHLDGAHLEGAVADEQTRWPGGFDWRAAGVIIAGEDIAASPPQPL